ncbi:BRCT domain-containing protein At4g02110-like [Impatiens glandulifera]|uniref:BRCT domain-containing protein At4g02110-like n=1 Tax=Impatiens glandulifera TaxID=253017 RepID=UPI001FB05347|nr:BRCT domain-containing protein At4g02110-like [Impatiens glandulifera]
MLGSTKKEYEYQSAAFAGVRFFLSGFDPLNAQKVRTKLIEGGGIDAGQYSSNCTHVIVDKIVYDDPICLAARSDGKILVTGLWVNHSYDIGMPVDPTAIMYRPLRDLNGIPGAKSLTVCLTGYQRQDRDDIMTMVGLIGAQFSKPLVASKITHLVCYKFEGEKYELAKKITKIKLVNHRWLEDCLSAWEILPESDYAKSGHEMEMDVEAKDSDEDVANDNNNEHNSQLKIGGSHTTYVETLTTNRSPLSKQDVSKTITPIRNNPSPLSKQDVSKAVTPIRNNLSPLSKQDVSKTVTPIRNNQSPLSKPDVSRTITPIRIIQSPLSKQDVSRTVTPTSANKRVINAQKANGAILATCEGLSNKTSPSQFLRSKEPVNQDATFMSSIAAFDKSPTSNNAQRSPYGSSMKTLNNGSNDELYYEDKQAGILPKKRTSDLPCNSSKLQKASPNWKEHILEPSLQCRFGGLGPEDNYDCSFMTNSGVSSAIKAQITRSPQPPSGNVSLFDEELGNKLASTSDSGMLKDSLNTELLKCGNDNSLSKTRKEMPAKKCLGSRSKFTPYSTEHQKGSLHSSRGTAQLRSSVAEEEMSKKYSREVEMKSAAVETNVAETNGDDVENGYFDAETEAPDMNEENEIEVGKVQDKHWVELAADPIMVADEEETLPQNEHRVSKIKDAKSKKRTLGKMSNKLVHSLPKTKKPKDDSHDMISKSEKKDETIDGVKVKRPNSARKKFIDDRHDKMAESEKDDEPFEEVEVKCPNSSRKKPNDDIHEKMAENEKKDETIEGVKLRRPNSSRKNPNYDSHDKMAEREKNHETIEKVKVKNSNASRKKPNDDIHEKTAESEKKEEMVEGVKVKTPNASRMKPIDDSYDKMAESGKNHETIEKVKVKRPNSSRKKSNDDSHDKPAESEKKDETIEGVKVKRVNSSRKKPNDDSHDKATESEKKDETIEGVKVKRLNSSRKKPKDDRHEKMSESGKDDEMIEEVKVERPKYSRKKPNDDSHEKMAQSEKNDEKVKVKRPNLCKKDKSVPKLVVDKENRPSVGKKNTSENVQHVGEVTPKLHETTPSVAARNEATCFILAGHRLQRKEFKQVIRRLKGKVCRDSHQWSYQATHFIVPDPLRRTEKFFAAAASGRWILKTDYLSASNEAGRFLEEKAYEWHKKGLSEDGAINMEAPRKWRLLRERTGHGAFYGMRVVIYGQCITPSLETLKRAIKAGDGELLATAPPYNRFIKSGVDFAVISPGMPRVDIWVQEFIEHEIPCIAADYLVEYVCKSGYSLDRHVQYNTQIWAERSFKKLAMMSEERMVLEEPRTPEGEDDMACQVCGCRDRGEEMLICGDEKGTVGCGVGMHLECCDPPLESVPEDDWFCDNCCKTASIGKGKGKKKGRK